MATLHRTIVRPIITERSSAVCVEPQTAPPDAIALDRFELVRPGAPLTARMSWRITKE